MAAPPRRPVSAARLRQAFAEDGLGAQIQSGYLTPAPTFRRDKEPERLPPGEPPGTRSQVFDYLDPSGERIVTVHRYLRPDGTLGASGLPDPKWIRRENEILILG